MVIAFASVIYGCGQNETKIVALEERVSAAELKIKKLESSAVPASTTTPVESTATGQESQVVRQGSQLLGSRQPSPVVTAPTPLPTQTLSGVGKQATQMITLQEGLYVFRFTHSGSSNFIVHLLDSEGRRVESLVNVIGVFSGSKATRISAPGQYILDIDADGTWTIVAGPPS